MCAGHGFGAKRLWRRWRRFAVPNSDTDSYSDAHSYSYSNPDSHTHTDADADSNSNAIQYGRVPALDLRGRC
jgi:hypothetical protein